MDIAGFDLDLLKAFDALYAERHVTHAGQRIGLSQSAMSGALTRLHEVFQNELFVRSPAGMQPTPRADDLAGPVSAALRLMREVLQADRFDPVVADHTVTIAMTDYTAFVLLPPLLARLSVAAPRLDIRVRGIFGRTEALALLDSGEANLAIGFPVQASARILVHPLFHEGFRAFRGSAIRPSRRARVWRHSPPPRTSWYRPGCSATPLMAGRIASPEMLPWTHPLPHLTCSRPEFTGDGHETDQHGNA
jgi:DNA-binding transcriptional LysR family regulator